MALAVLESGDQKEIMPDGKFSALLLRFALTSQVALKGYGYGSRGGIRLEDDIKRNASDRGWLHIAAPEP